MGIFDGLSQYLSDPQNAAQIRGALIGASQAIGQPYGNIGMAATGAAMGAQTGLQNYQQKQMQNLDLQSKQLGLTSDKFGMQQKLGSVNFLRNLQGQQPLTLNDIMQGNFGSQSAPPPMGVPPSGQVQPQMSPAAPMASPIPNAPLAQQTTPQPVPMAPVASQMVQPVPLAQTSQSQPMATAPLKNPRPDIIPDSLWANPLFQAAAQSGDSGTVMSMLSKHQTQLTPDELKTANLPPDTLAFKAPDGTIDIKRTGTIQSPEEISSAVAAEQAKGLKSTAEIQQDLATEAAKKRLDLQYQPPSVERSITLPILQKLQRGEQLTPGEQSVLQATKPNAGVAYDQQADFAKPLGNTAYEAVAQSVANYDRSEATALSRYPAPIRAQIQARVSSINPGYQQTNYNEANATKLAFAKGPQGQSVQSLNSTISHMDLMKQYVTALNNGDIQTVNALKNAIKTEFGGTAPTNAMAVAEILGPEMAKAVLPNGGTGPEREGFVDTLKTKAAQGQLVGVLDTYQGLMSGQLLSLKKRYENIPGQPKDFENKFLLPETQQILANRPEYHGGITSGPASPPASNPSQKAMLPRPKTPADAAALKHGTHFLDPQGNERVR